MNIIVPEKLKKGDEVRVIAPSQSMRILGKDCIEIAKKRLEDMGLKVTFGKNAMNSMSDNYNCASIEDRIEDLHEAFRDTNVKAIMTAIGGFNSNQLLDYIDYELIKENPKILCGFSDITALLEAIHAKTGLEVYYGPHFSSLGMKKGCEYTIKHFANVLMNDEKDIINSSEKWSDDLWFIDQENRTFIENKGMKIVNKGEAEGRLVGGNLCTFNLLQGTEYMPDVENKILFLEDDGGAGKVFNRNFDRDLQSLLHLCKGKNIKAIIFGRAQKNCEMTEEKWIEIIKNKKELKNIPIVINADFGHTTPICTIPIGGYAKIKFDKNINIEITK